MSVLRPITAADHGFVLALNERFVHQLSPLDGERLVQLLALAKGAYVITDPEANAGAAADAGFVITFDPGVAYDSANYRWFSARYPSFRYLDRVVLDPDFQRRGLASRAYDELEAGTSADRPMTLEVNVDPPNEASLAFHAARGYVEVGREGSPGKRVAFLRRPGQTVGLGD